jgi:hypothetical protein
VSLFVYAGPPGGHYSYLPTRHGTAPFSDLRPGDVIDFGEHQPPDDELWTTAKSSAVANRRPDNAPAPVPAFSSAPQEPAPRRARPVKTQGADG